MIQEEFVQFETSKLLKAAGFPQFPIEPDGTQRGVPCIKCYTKDGLLTDWIFQRGNKKACSAPTQAQAMRWLREHEVVVIVDVEYFRYDIKNAKYRYNIYPNDCAKQTRSQYTYPTYEAAAEAGIQAARKYLIEKGGEE